MFSVEEIQKLLEIVDYHSSFVAASTLGGEILTSYDKLILEQHGIDIENILSQHETSYYEMYMWGKLSALLQDKQIKQLTYKDFETYIRTGQYVPLTQFEQRQFGISKQKTYEHIKGLGQKIKKDVNGLISEKSNLSRKQYEKIIGDELKEGVLKRKTLTSIVGEIGNKTNDWTRDWGRIVETEYNNIFQTGRSQKMEEVYGENAIVFKDVYSGACKHCIQHYLTNGIGSKPKLFKLIDLQNNGTNVGRKVRDWKPVVESMHPFCRCTLRHLPDDYIWDKENEKFKPNDKKELKYKRTAKAKVTIGSKTFLV